MLTARSRLIAVGLGCLMVAGSVMVATAPASAGARRAAPRPAGAVASVIAADRHHATRVARAMLADVVLPSGSALSRPRLAGRDQPLARPSAMIFVADQVDVRRFWTTSAGGPEVLSSIAAHLPAHVKRQATGYTSGEIFTTYLFPKAASPTIAIHQLAVTTVRSGKRTVVRVDAEVEFRAPRLPRQDVPPSARVLDLTKAGARHPGLSSHPKIRTELARTITRPALVRRIAALANALPLEGNERGVAFSCPEQPTGFPVDTFTFRARAGGRPLAVITMNADTPAAIDPCADEQLKLGRRTLGLQDGGVLLRRVAAILHLRLGA